MICTNFLKDLYCNIKNKYYGYELSRLQIEELIHTNKILELKVPIEHYDEIYSRALRGNRKCLDLLIKILNDREEIVFDINLNDCVSINFKGDKQLWDGLNKIKEAFIDNEQEIIIRGTRVFMKLWVFNYVFGEYMVYDADKSETPLPFDFDLTIIKLLD